MTDDTDLYYVVTNEEEQHSIWPVHLDIPGGWAVKGAPDTRSRCLERIEQEWPDITPKSMRTC